LNDLEVKKCHIEQGLEHVTIVNLSALPLPRNSGKLES
jgi:hypothetical protein